MEFTKDTSKVLASIYKIYLERRKSGQSKNEAKLFNHDFYKETKALSNWIDSDISDSLHELFQAKFIKMYLGGNFAIENILIIQMENRFKSGINEVAKYLADLVSDIATGLIF